MTPQEAVAELVNTGAIATLESEAGVARTLIDACVATARAEAKKKETRRCAARVKGVCAIPGFYTAPVASLGENLADDILITGGLKVEDETQEADTQAGG